MDFAHFAKFILISTIKQSVPSLLPPFTSKSITVTHCTIYNLPQVSNKQTPKYTELSFYELFLSHTYLSQHTSPTYLHNFILFHTVATIALKFPFLLRSTLSHGIIFLIPFSSLLRFYLHHFHVLFICASSSSLLSPLSSSISLFIASLQPLQAMHLFHTSVPSYRVVQKKIA